VLTVFVQGLAGPTALGVVRQPVHAILHGTGANAKSVLCNAIAAALDDYGASSTIDLLLQTGRSPGQATPELADLRGRRLVTVAETPEDGRLAAERVKWLTGGDPITARRLYGQPFTFQPTHSVWLQTNHLPRVPDDGHAIWRRLLLVPFDVTIPEAEQDSELGAKLATERAGILRWIVDGARAYLREGLNPPAAVRSATTSYREDEDVFGGFLAERTIGEEGASAQGADLLRAYTAWAEQSGAPALSTNALADKLHARGFERKRGKTGSRWHGLRLRQESTLDV
jgi:putative DNA primase/helicase